MESAAKSMYQRVGAVLGRFGMEQDEVAGVQKSRKKATRAAKEVAQAERIARKLAKVAPNEDPADVAGAIVILATETIKRSAKTLPEARAYLDGLRTAIDGLLQNAFPQKSP